MRRSSHDLRTRVRDIEGRTPAPRAAIVAARTVPSTSDSGAHAGDDGQQRRTGSTVHVAVDPLS